MNKRTYLFVLRKNPERQGAWLLVWERNIIVSEDTRARIIEEVEGSSGASAWTTKMAAKRSAAHMLGRSRLTWIDEDDVLRAQVTVKE
jgi:hypothetical protein